MLQSSKDKAPELILEANRRFGGYKPESERRASVPSLRHDLTLERLREAWRSLVTDQWTAPDRASIIKTFESFRCTKADVENFSIALAEFQDERFFSSIAGFALGILINNGTVADYTVHTGHMSLKIDDFGYKNRKEIVVIGDVGNELGHEMDRGKISVMGDAGDSVGSWMKGGHIEIRGNAGNMAGSDMFDGNIAIHGNTGIMCGSGQKGGEITVHGDTGNALGYKMSGGRIVVGGSAGLEIGRLMESWLVSSGGDKYWESMVLRCLTNNDWQGIEDAIKAGHVSRVVGEIFLEGDYGGISSEFKEGRIYHKGKLIAGG